MDKIELRKEWTRALQDYEERPDDWNLYFYLLTLKEQLSKYGIETEEI